jgi:hypothetical protein
MMGDMNDIPDLKPNDIKSALKVMKILQMMRRSKSGSHKTPHPAQFTEKYTKSSKNDKNSFVSPEVTYNSNKHHNFSHNFSQIQSKVDTMIKA